MRYLFLLLLVGLISCSDNKNSNEAPEETKTEATSYGDPVEVNNSVDLTKMVSQLENQDSLQVTVKGEISSTCKMKGCWMNIKLPDGEEMRVTFKDYGFFVPKEGMEGKTAVFEGYVKKTVVDEETRKHFAKDGGQSEEEIASITGDEEQLAFVANGVVIYQ